MRKIHYTETIALFPILVSSSKAKTRRKQEETMQRFNRISCKGRVTLHHSFPFPHLFRSLFLHHSVSMLLDISLIAGERRMCWSGEWDHWEYLDIQVTSMIVRIVGCQNNFNRRRAFLFFYFYPVGCVSHRLCNKEGFYSKSVGDYSHRCILFHKLWLVDGKTALNME